MDADPASAELPPLLSERPEDAAAVEQLILKAFGPGRYVKAAERLREGRTPVFEVSFVAWEGGRAMGCVRQWAVRIADRPALLLGPFAVDAACRSRGLGAALVARACEAAEDAGWPLIVLVGDAPYFEPLGFSAKAAAQVLLPGPVDRRRVLVRALQPGAAEGLAGTVTAVEPSAPRP